MTSNKHQIIKNLEESLLAAPAGSRVVVYSDEYTLAELPMIINQLYSSFKNPEIEIKNKVLRIGGELYD